MADPIRVLLVDDQVLMRDALKALLMAQRNGLSVEVVGEAEDGLKAVRVALDTRPDLVLLDIIMPKMRGSDAVHELKTRLPNVKVIMLTSAESSDDVRISLDEGADGYVQKNAGSEGLFEAISTVMSGQKFLCQETRKRLEALPVDQNGLPPDLEPKGYYNLSRRERQVLKLVAEGNKNREIAHLLFINIKTVEKHRANLRAKTNAKTTADLVASAIKEGLIKIQYAPQQRTSKLDFQISQK